MSLNMDASFVLKWKCGSEALTRDIVQRNGGTEPADCHHVTHLYIIFLKYLVSGVGFKPSSKDSHLPSMYSPSNQSRDRTLPNSDHHPATLKVPNRSRSLALNSLFFGHYEFLHFECNRSQHCYTGTDVKLRLKAFLMNLK